MMRVLCTGRRRMLGSTCSGKRLTLSSSVNRGFSSLPSWATADPKAMGTDADDVYAVPNLVGGTWTNDTSRTIEIPNPMDKDMAPIFTIPDTQVEELGPFLDSLRKVPKSGLHNPLKNSHRYVEYGEISRLAGAALMEHDEFFAQAIMRCVPKSHGQALGEVKVTADFLNNFGGDNVRLLGQSFGTPGNYYGNYSHGYRWPYGPVALVTPFNFPLEIPVLQLMGALFMGNKPVLKPSEPTSFVMEQFVRLLVDCGMDPKDMDILNCKGPVAQELILQTPVRLTQFTGSSKVAELLSRETHGKVKVEDAGFDWKILGPDVDHDVDYVAWQCDQDAYAATGQKCSAQSILFVHENWKETGLMDKIKINASQRSMDDLTVGPVLTVTTEAVLKHVASLLEIPGAELLFGGKELSNHNIPPQYGAVEPTAVFVPLEEMMKDPETFSKAATEIFAPFQVITYFNDETLDLVLEALESMSHHLTAGVVSNDLAFTTKVLAHTVNGTTYAGKRARTTGAPQWHHFGPAGDPRGASIGTREAIQNTWSCHREIIHDSIIPADWTQPKTT